MLTSRRFARFMFALLLFGSFHGFGLAQSAMDPQWAFPLSEGTYWIYKGVVSVGGSGDQVSERNVTWKMESRHVIRRADVTVWVVSGFPADLDWSESDPQPRDSLVIQNKDGKVYQIGAEASKAAIQRLGNPADALDGLLTDDDLMFQLPLKQGLRFGDAQSMARDDGMYCWFVDSSAVRNLREVKGLTSPQRTVFELRYQTNPDDSEFGFSSGLGITSYSYHHHGTVADTELRLVEVHFGTKQ